MKLHKSYLEETNILKKCFTYKYNNERSVLLFSFLKTQKQFFKWPLVNHWRRRETLIFSETHKKWKVEMICVV